MKKIIFQLLIKEMLTVKDASNFNRGNLSLQFCQQTRRLIFSLLNFDAFLQLAFHLLIKKTGRLIL